MGWCEITAIVRRMVLEKVEQELTRIAATGDPGDGIVAILPVDAVFRIRAGAPASQPFVP